MRGKTGRGLTLSLLAGLVVPGDAGAEPLTDPWTAGDRLDRFGEIRGAPGWRCRADATTLGAVPGTWESGLGLSYQPERGVGASARWRRFWLDAAPVDDLTVSGMLSGRGWRIRLGVGAIRRGPRRLGRLEGSLEIQPLTRLLAGCRWEVFPDQPAWAPQVVLRLFGREGPWSGGLDLGPGAGAWRLGVGLEIRPGLVWLAAYAESSPMVGVALRLGPGEIRVRSTRNPWLGAVTRISWIWGGLGS